MGDIDTYTKEYVSQPEVYADVFNYLLFQGEQIILPSSLTEQDITEISIPYGTENDKELTIPVQKLRDILKLCTIKSTDDTIYMLLGIENQANIHYAMPVRSMLYDALNYAGQTSKLSAFNRKDKNPKGPAEFLSGLQKHDKIKPVVTAVVYWGSKKWDAPRQLHDMLTLNKYSRGFVPNYKLNLIVPNEICDFDKFRSDLKYSLPFLKYAEDNKSMNELMSKEPGYQSLNRLTSQLLSTVTGITIPQNSIKEEGVDMCKAWQDHYNEGMSLGITQGIIEDIRDSINEILGRFGGISDEIISLISSQDNLDTLKKWRTTAIYATSLEDFLRKIA